MESVENVKRWLTFKLVSIAARLHFDMFIKLAKVALIAHHKEEIEDARAILQLEYEALGEYYYNHERNGDDIDPSKLH